MNKKNKFFVILTICFLLTFINVHASEQKTFQQNEITTSTTLHTFSSKVLEAIKNIPGLETEEFSTFKIDISKTWDTLLKNGYLEITGTDKDVRPSFVGLQGVIEQVLAIELQKDIKDLKGIIHTPMPATPLCSQGDVSKELVAPAIEMDPASLFTVKARTTIIRDYLFKGGELYVVYPKDGYSKRTEEQRKIYQQELINYPKNLFDVPVNSDRIPIELVGATYLFQDLSGDKFVFAIKMTQAKDPQDSGNFGLWFGPIHHPAIQKRLQVVLDYLKENNIYILAE